MFILFGSTHILNMSWFKFSEFQVLGQFHYYGCEIHKYCLTKYSFWIFYCNIDLGYFLSTKYTLQLILYWVYFTYKSILFLQWSEHYFCGWGICIEKGIWCMYRNFFTVDLSNNTCLQWVFYEWKAFSWLFI